jgi:hypothetical protein
LEAQSILHWSDLRTVPANSYEVFEVMSRESGARLQFYAAQSEIHFYTWGERQCCLERGSTSATLLNDSNLQLEIGDVLVFEEVLGPVTGNPADADPTRRHAVRLTEVTAGEDGLSRQPIIEIKWAAEDALPFPFCISAIGEAPDCKYLENISVARGNLVLVDHGKTIGPEDLGPGADAANASGLRMRRSSERRANSPRPVSSELCRRFR